MQDSALVDSLVIDSSLTDTLISITESSSEPTGWMIVIYIIIGIFLVTALGFFLYKKREKTIVDEINFTDNYREHLTTFLESNGQDMESYSWLIDRSVKMQRMMGGLGKISYTPPYSQYRISNQDIVIGFVPQIKKEFENELNTIAPNFQTLTFYSDSLQEALIRFVGVEYDQLEEIKKDLKNPLIWFVLGFRQLLSLPIYIFVLFGLMSDHKASDIRDSIIFKIISLIFFLIGVIASIFTIVLGWTEFWNLINSYLG